MGFKIEGPLRHQSSVCVPILRALPDWFGIEEDLLAYEREIEGLPTFLARSGGRTAGFLSLKQHNPFSTEIYVMGVRPEARRLGLGRLLVDAAEGHAHELGAEYMQVKTLGPSRPDKGYAATLAFYAALGYRPLEEFSQIWGENNPCLILVKRLMSEG
jgi:ribosomal protein S18 acetylase RimI-like enzyme